MDCEFFWLVFVWFLVTEEIEIVTEESNVGVAGERVDSEDAVVLEFEEGAFESSVADVECFV